MKNCPGILTALLGTEIFGFNVETQQPVEHKGDIDSYFGFSADIDDSKRRKKILVGAPKFQGNGSVYECDVIFGENSSCTKLQDPEYLDPYGSYVSSKNLVPDRGHRLLGAAVKYTDDSEKIYCAPGDGKWKHVYPYDSSDLQEKEIDKFITGDGDFRFRRFGSCWIDDERYQLSDDGKGKGWRIIDRERDVVISALDTSNANGVLLSYSSINSGGRKISTSQRLKKIVPGDEVSRKEGFKSGADFLDIPFGPSKGRLLVGAPQFDGVTKNGIVLIADGSKFLKPSDFSDLDEFCIQAGQQFGHSLALGQIEPNQKAWLAVGAPTWSDLHHVKANLGKVYVYEMTADGEFTAKFVLEGDKDDQYFGNALVGGIDLNYDGYEDLIVASKNKLSVFNGNKENLLNTDIDPQVIPTSSMTRQLTVSRNLLLAGIPEDSTVKVYRTRPVVEVTFEQKMKDDLIPVSTKPVSETIIDWQACAEFVEKSARNRDGSEVTLAGSTVSIKLDSKYSSPRLTYKNKSEFDLPLRKEGSKMCTKEIKMTVTSTQLSSKIRPIVVSAKVNANIPEGIMAPILSPISQIEVDRELEFDRNCPPDNLCNSKLQAENDVTINQPNLAARTQKLTNSIIMDTKNVVTVTSLLKVGPQQSYGAVLEYVHPLITANTTAYTEGSQNCEQKDGVRTCQIGNPLRPGDYRFETTFTFDDPRAREEMSKLQVNFLNENKRPQPSEFEIDIPNAIVHNLPLKSKTYIKSGEFPDEPVSKAFYNDETEGIGRSTLKFEVNFQIFNLGPASFRNVFERVKAFYPSSFKTEHGDKLKVLTPTSMKLQQTQGKDILTTVNCEHQKAKKSKKAAAVEPTVHYQDYSCENSLSCDQITCPKPPRPIDFKDGHRLTLKVEFDVHEDLFFVVSNHSRIFTRLDFDVHEEDFIYGFGAQAFSKTITNELQVQLKSLSRTESIPFWVIIVAALGAFLIILIVVLIMWKKKCFEYGPKTTQATTSKAETAPMLQAKTEDIQ
ncbi:Oidioi.mRNA.OKI2018_I69.PAR.g9382.t2.cds [Oikopleura dioica]|uniref:Oidioi.mRNA.OKI2018_I69.PAR.g9382.t2.cds n=1 Tax=Oikopleura dioica TaxID=34765 RepID=A0ABN7RK80_OIKDI|nr:Oidioi.mRNA.OKI2018_I69.PAR.g9382.t2.cds [Oikopleura dioica]